MIKENGNHVNNFQDLEIKSKSESLEKLFQTTKNSEFKKLLGK